MSRARPPPAPTGRTGVAATGDVVGRLPGVVAGPKRDEPGRRAFGQLEGDVLAALWAADRPLTTPEVHEVVGQDLAYTTVATVLTRLADKGVITRRKAGRALEYAPASDEVDVASSGFRSILTRSHDRRALLQGFVESLSTDDEAILRELLADAKGSRKKGG
jgi:predicted transcriptional regulator